ncbi:hypothetical protein H5410_058024 [Solanum commersonii]|uniref:Uncharacterized protein n=1 Tax=Solanum commersonii TaxID=4109 RepID=A0A9J5WQJ9_SOLCO|nr:hypothetical protein H5410_058024 [Solanum commersonii]
MEVKKGEFLLAVRLCCKNGVEWGFGGVCGLVRRGVKARILGGDDNYYGGVGYPMGIMFVHCAFHGFRVEKTSNSCFDGSIESGRRVYSYLVPSPVLHDYFSLSFPRLIEKTLRGSCLSSRRAILFLIYVFVLYEKQRH